MNTLLENYLGKRHLEVQCKTAIACIGLKTSYNSVTLSPLILDFSFHFRICAFRDGSLALYLVLSCSIVLV